MTDTTAAETLRIANALTNVMYPADESGHHFVVALGNGFSLYAVIIVPESSLLAEIDFYLLDSESNAPISSDANRASLTLTVGRNFPAEKIQKFASAIIKSM